MSYLPGCSCSDCKKKELQERMNPGVSYRFEPSQLDQPLAAKAQLKENTVTTEAQLEASIAKQKEELRKLKALGEDNYPVGTVLFFEDQEGKCGSILKSAEDTWAPAKNNPASLVYGAYPEIAEQLARRASEIFIVTELTKIA